MSEDRFGEVTEKLAIATLRQVPILGLVVEAAEAFLPPSGDAVVRQAVINEMGDTVIRLQAKVEELGASLAQHGKKLDEIGAMHTVMLTREVAQATAASRSPEKREAVLNAAAQQFDPTYSAAARAHWFEQVRKLTDMQVLAIRLVAQHGRISQDENYVLHAVNATGGFIPLGLSRDENVALHDTIESMPGNFLTGNIGAGIELTRTGRILAKYVMGKEAK